MRSDSLRFIVDLFKTLAHPVRLRILALLRDGELCVCQIKAVIGLPTSTISEHLTHLRRAGVLEERKEGRWVYYTLQPRPEVEGQVAALWSQLMGADLVLQDTTTAREIRRIPVEVTCLASKTCRFPSKATLGPVRGSREETLP